MRSTLPAEPSCPGQNHSRSNHTRQSKSTNHNCPRRFSCLKHSMSVTSYTPGLSHSAQHLSMQSVHGLTSLTCRPDIEPASSHNPRRRRWHFHTGSRLATVSTLAFVLITFLLISPASAVQVPISNCLPDEYQNSKPKALQWEPYVAEADFLSNGNGDDRTLRLVVWGNVVGSYKNVTPPEPTDGKIIDTVKGSGKATTLLRKVGVLTYEPWNNYDYFCANGLVNGSCPLAPVDHDKPSTTSEARAHFPSFNMTHDFSSSYSFASLSATLLVLFGDADRTTIGCISATLTPDLGQYSDIARYLPLAILLVAGFAVILAAIYSPWGSMNVFHWTSNYGRDADLLRLVTPGFGDCLQYIQFIVLTGSLRLNYPGFYQPGVSKMSWSTLMFNESLVTHSPPWQSVIDGIYVTNGTYGLDQVGQLAGMANGQDIWAGMMVWLCVIIAAVFVLIQTGFLIQWVYRRIQKTPEEDLRAKNIPFFIGNVVRIVFNYMLLPLVALSCFQLVIAGQDDRRIVTIALSAITLILLVGFASWLLFLVITTRPRSVLFDDLPTLLLYGPIYNTYSDDQATFALVPILLTFIRGIAIGGIQASGIVQVVLLAICEILAILTLQGFRPFNAPTSMNAYHITFSLLKLATILLMVAFAPSLGVTEDRKGWIGYAILLVHACVLVFGFFLSSLQTIIEVVARVLGAGGNNEGGQTRGGLTKIFGMRELSKRETQREGPSRASQLSTSAMLDLEDGPKTGYVMPSGRVRSGSGASLSGMTGRPRHRSSSAFDSVDVNSAMNRGMDSASSYMPGTPGDASTFSFLPSQTVQRQSALPLNLEASDPYYRPPRRRTDTVSDSMHSDTQLGASGPLGIDMRQHANLGGQSGELVEPDTEPSRGATPAPAGAPVANQSGGTLPSRPDYATREVDFYYGVRGPALNSEGPGRKLGTGPADPTGPVATATGWFRNFLGGKTKEKGKGFEVVRSSRMPPSMMAPHGGFGDETPPEGIPVATGVQRKGLIDSDDEDGPAPKETSVAKQRDLLRTEGDEEVSDLDEPIKATGKQSEMGPDDVSDEEDEDDDSPGIPRKSSKRTSGMQYIQLHLPSLSLVESETGSTAGHSTHDTDNSRTNQGHDGSLLATSTLPFERSGSQKRLSSKSSMEFPGDLTDVNLHDRSEERPASFGMVPHHGISRVDPAPRSADHQGSTAELVDENGVIKNT